MESKNGNALRFLWNGIKAADGKLQRCWYSDGQLYDSPAGTITIYAREYRSFSAEVYEAFEVINHSDPMTDYFDQDTIRVTPDHPLYAKVQVAAGLLAEHNRKVLAKRGL